MVDENCDGVANCTGAYLWSEKVNDSTRFGFDSDGNIILVGTFNGPFVIDHHELGNDGEHGIFIVKLDPSGNFAWSRLVIGAISVGGMAVDHGGNIIVTGGLTGSVAFGGVSLASVGSDDAYVLKLNGNGDHIWSTSFVDGVSAASYGSDVSIGFDDAIILMGFFGESINLGGEILQGEGEQNKYLAKFDSAGKHDWSVGFTNIIGNDNWNLSVDVAGAIVLSGTFTESLSFGDGIVLTTAGNYDAFLVKFDADGSCVWGKNFGSGSNEGISDTALDSAGNILAVGSFYGGISFGGSTLQSSANDDIFVVQFDSNGNEMWSKSFGDSSGNQNCQSVSIDADRNIVLAGNFYGSIDFGAGALESVGNVDGFAAKLNKFGDPMWSVRFGGVSSDYGRRVAVDSLGNVLLVGDFSYEIEFGGDKLNCGSGGCSFFAKLAP